MISRRNFSNGATIHIGSTSTYPANIVHSIGNIAKVILINNKFLMRNLLMKDFLSTTDWCFMSCFFSSVYLPISRNESKTIHNSNEMFAIFRYMTVNTFDQVSTCRREKSTSSTWQIEYDGENTIAILVRMTLLAKKN